MEERRTPTLEESKTVIIIPVRTSSKRAWNLEGEHGVDDDGDGGVSGTPWC